MAAEPAIKLPVPITVGGPPVSLMPSIAANTTLAAPQAALSNALKEAVGTQHTSDRGRALETALASADVKSVPALAHIAAAGASLFDLRQSHGLRTVYARNHGEVMVFAVTPDGQASVAGLMTDLSVDQLRAIGGKAVSELPPQHGLRALFLRNGPQFQVFYASPDGERLIPGVMWDAAGQDLTRELVASIPGTVPTVTLGSNTSVAAIPASTTSRTAGGASLLAIARGTTHGSIGNAAAPELWMFVDPQCSFSVRAMQQLTPSITAGKVHLNVIPLSLLDAEDGGLSTRSALDLVGSSSERMVTAWEAGRAIGARVPDARARLEANMAAATAIQLRGTPTFIWRKADGSEGRLDGLPPDIDALVAALGS